MRTPNNQYNVRAKLTILMPQNKSVKRQKSLKVAKLCNSSLQKTSIKLQLSQRVRSEEVVREFKTKSILSWLDTISKRLKKLSRQPKKMASMWDKGRFSATRFQLKTLDWGRKRNRFSWTVRSKRRTGKWASSFAVSPQSWPRIRNCNFTPSQESGWMETWLRKNASASWSSRSAKTLSHLSGLN